MTNPSKIKRRNPRRDHARNLERYYHQVDWLDTDEEISCIARPAIFGGRV